MPLEFIVKSSIELLTIVASFMLVLMARTLLRDANLVFNAPRAKLLLALSLLSIGINATIDYSYLIYRFTNPVKDCTLAIKHPDCYRSLRRGGGNTVIHNNYENGEPTSTVVNPPKSQ